MTRCNWWQPSLITPQRPLRLHALPQRICELKVFFVNILHLNLNLWLEGFCKRASSSGWIICMQKRPNDYSYFPSMGIFEQHLSSLPPCKSTTFLTLPEIKGNFKTQKLPLEINLFPSFNLYSCTWWQTSMSGQTEIEDEYDSQSNTLWLDMPWFSR